MHFTLGQKFLSVSACISFRVSVYSSEHWKASFAMLLGFILSEIKNGLNNVTEKQRANLLCVISATKTSEHDKTELPHKTSGTQINVNVMLFSVR
jgi:hypothetical protein